ncbi:anti-sigma regulatory factor (Ser/Thr protein kinase) [Kitasatospora sp. MAA4]|uniref:ATP-binding protein n=1 Tax=Kitasatospora sp. MAA4 TaxID=3035093 RepID=UPI002473C034|nr:ATP-binding protein [Kitasatospora sp. MAA4]MDH6132847.1 anti-sigma regulatory factor (Ser/Thr protein kinase) [Kitasatospora sp. MAA4]
MSPLDTASFPVPQEWDVEPTVAAVPAARRLIVSIARFWKVPLSEDALRDVELCAGELLANAMEHTQASCRVTVRWTGERLRVEVADTSIRLPDPDNAQDTATGGRGLCLVSGLSHSWGWTPTGAGKIVWFECAADQLVAGDRHLAVLVHATQSQVMDRFSQSA